MRLNPTAPVAGEPVEALLRDFESVDRSRSHALEPSLLLRLFRGLGIGAGHPGRTPGRGAERERHGVEERAGGHRAGRGDAGLAARFRRACRRSLSERSTTPLPLPPLWRSQPPGNGDFPRRGREGWRGLRPGRCTRRARRIPRFSRRCTPWGWGGGAFVRSPPGPAGRWIRLRWPKRSTDDATSGFRPLAVVPTIGTTSTTAVDPVGAVAEVARSRGLWLHVDAAYAGVAAALPGLRHHFAGWERADSIVINPHKWLFTPVDCSVLFVRDPAELRAAFSLVPAYLETSETGVTHLMDHGLALGRRFRSLKLWFVMRYFGQDGLRAILARHIALARRLAAAVDRPGGNAGARRRFRVPVVTLGGRRRGTRRAEHGDHGPGGERGRLSVAHVDGETWPLSGTFTRRSAMWMPRGGRCVASGGAGRSSRGCRSTSADRVGDAGTKRQGPGPGICVDGEVPR